MNKEKCALAEMLNRHRQRRGEEAVPTGEEPTPCPQAYTALPQTVWNLLAPTSIGARIREGGGHGARVFIRRAALCKGRNVNP